ncbi:MAG: sigma-54-dependent Fis family transcriptional regulator [Bdellovibrionaceae bacterium]|jgi:two-component system, NtrC family, response regulator AtoC|nr:sigma-54-dependent Fis family transcriptional regulator [Pseudobdellovibrionaceae bacterium]
MNKTINTLIVDDEPELRKAVITILENSELPEVNILEAGDGQEAIDLVQENQNIDFVIMDVKMPRVDGLEALERIKAINPKIFIVIITAHSNLQDAITAIKSGAYDYLEKPVDSNKLIQIMKKCIDAQGIINKVVINNPIFDDDLDSKFVKGSEKMKGVYNLIYKLGQVDTTVLIRGDNGTGKELVAHAIHQNSSRKHGEFVAINCAAIPESLMESEIFGHEKGAFTGADKRKIGLFQHANNGTIFLDEIGEIPPEMQVKLLRVLQEKKFVPVGSHREIETNARVIAATNRNLEQMIESKTFREDLFYRLNVMPIFLPPLKERLDDIYELCTFFVNKYNVEHGKIISGIHADVLSVFKNYTWPGNIRELENIIQRAFILEESPLITIKSIPEQLIQKAKEQELKFSQDFPGAMDFDKFKEESEKDFIITALKANKGKINKTVASANIPKNTLLRKIKKYMINVKDFH